MCVWGGKGGGGKGGGMTHRIVHYLYGLGTRLSYTLLQTPWGPGGVSCIERRPHFRGNFN